MSSRAQPRDPIRIGKDNKDTKITSILWTGEEKTLTVHYSLDKPEEQLQLMILLLGKETDTLTLNLSLTHTKQQTQSTVTIISLLTGSAHIAVHAQVTLAQAAHRSKTWLEAKALLLSDHASAQIIPGLAIHCEDVSAGHATVIKPMDPEELMYLSSRGIGADEAKKLIVTGILQQYLPYFSEQDREKINEFVIARL